MPQEWHRLGAVGACAGARAAAVLGDQVYAVAEDGQLWRIAPDACTAGPVGDRDWRVRLLAAARGQLYAFEESGSLYAVEPAAARHERLDRDWAAVRAAAGGEDELFVSGEALCAVEPDGDCRRIGQQAWNPRLLLASAEHVFSLEENGALYRIEIADGSWEQLDGDWADVTAGVALGGVLYLASMAGWLYAVTRSGEVVPVPCGAPPGSRFLLPSPQALFALEQDGTLHTLSFA